LIPRLYDVTEGSITIGGKNVKDIHRNALRNHIGMVLQQTFLFSGTIMENITYGKEEATLEEVLRVSKGAGAHEFIESFEAGYKTELGQKAMNISGGQKQRISIARGLLRQPYILVLDDSTSAVDVATEARIQKSLKEMTGKSIVILIAQRISSILDADRILVLEEGRIVGNGSHETLIKDNQAYREIYESQLGKVGEVYGA
jgi:ATP-binding cassette subfamily B protein